METRLPSSEIGSVHRALRRKEVWEQFYALADVLLWRNEAVSDLLDPTNGPTEQPNICQIAFATLAMLDMQVMNGGLLQFIGNCPGWLDHVPPSLRSVGFPMLANLFEHSMSDMIGQIDAFAEFRKRHSLEDYAECAGEFNFREFESAYFRQEGDIQVKSVAFVSERLSDFVA